MAQKKISNYFSSKCKDTFNDESQGIKDLENKKKQTNTVPEVISQNQSVEAVQTIKQEKQIEFVCVLPAYNPDKLLSGTFKVKMEANKVENLPKYHRKKNKKTKTKQLKCGVCNKELKSLDTLKRHRQIHEKRIQCPICSFHFVPRRFETHLKDHEIKEKEPKFECNVCSKKFFKNENLSAHLKLHQARYHCKLCDEKFVKKLIRDEHVQLHKDPDAFNCDVCQESFQQKATLQKHLLSEHQGQVYQCRHCPSKHKFTKKNIVNVTRRICACKLWFLSSINNCYTNFSLLL